MQTSKTNQNEDKRARSSNFDESEIGQFKAAPPFQLFASTQNDPASSKKEDVEIPCPDRCLQDGNDYFDEHGEYIYTDNTLENGIRVMARSTWQGVEKEFGDRLYVDSQVYQDIFISLKSKSRSLRKIPFTTPSDKESIGRLMDFYLSMMGYSPGASSAKVPGREATMVTGVDDWGQKHIYLSLQDDQTIRFPFLADNKFEFMNTLVHEKCHFDSHYEEEESHNEKITYEPLGTEKDESMESCLRHLESYFAQMEHGSWGKTSLNYKTRRIQYVGVFIAHLKLHEVENGKDHELSDSWSLKFQKEFKFRFKNGVINTDPDVIDVEFLK